MYPIDLPTHNAEKTSADTAKRPIKKPESSFLKICKSENHGKIDNISNEIPNKHNP